MAEPCEPTTTTTTTTTTNTSRSTTRTTARVMDDGLQPDKRKTAYDSIFGRPINHNRSSNIPPPDPYQAHYQPPLQNNRASFAGSVASSTQSHSAGVYAIQTTTGYMSPVAQQQQLRQSYYVPGQPVYYVAQPQTYQYQAYPTQYRPPSVPQPARSQPPGVVAPLPNQEPPDAGLEHLTRQGLTAAQAYQAQVYLNSPNQTKQRPSYYENNSPSPSEYSQRTPNPNRRSSPQITTTPPPPSLLPSVEIDRSGLGLSDLDGLTPDSPDDLHWNRDTPSPNGSHYHSASSSISNRSHRDSETLSTSSSSIPSHMQNSLQLIAANPSLRQYSGDGSPPSSSRHSSDSSRTMPRSIHRRSVPVQDRTRSMHASTPKALSMVDFGNILPPQYSPMGGPPHGRAGGSSRSNAVVTATRKSPIVYPAMLSNVAEAFKARITLSERAKDGLAYQDAFDGREAVDKIAFIIKTTDRNLALLLGRALDAQKFFHDVTYDHRLRDTPHEIYQFKSRLPTPFVSGEEVTTPSSAIQNGMPPQARPSLLSDPSNPDSMSSGASQQSDATTLSPQASTSSTTRGEARYARRPRRSSVSSMDDAPLPSGVFTLLTDCYSPTCTRDALCYSIACPRRLEQQARLNMKPQPGLRRSISGESLGDYIHHEAGTLWIHSVPQEVIDSVSEMEKRRQEAINEVVYTERDFVRDMEYLRDVWIKPLQTSDIIPEDRRTDFIEQVFWNIHEIIAVNVRLRDALRKRQQSYAVVETIGDIFLDVVPHFQPFVKYGAHQLYGKWEFEKEKASNPAFAQFVDEIERLPVSRKLELNGYLTKPTTRLARYPLLLEVVLKHTSEENPDKWKLVQVVKIVRGFLEKVNEETGRTENRFNLLQLDQQLVFRNVEAVDLRLKDDSRELLFKGLLKKDSGDLQVFLFDHALLMVKPKTKHEQYRVYRRPIPLELLVVSAQDDGAGRPPTARGKQSLMKRSSFSKDKDRGDGKDRLNLTVPPLRPETRNGFALTFMYLGRKGYVITLGAPTPIGRKKWLEVISKQQEVLRARSMTFETVTLSEGFFFGPNKVNCAAPFDRGRRLAFGTDSGVYFADLRDRSRAPVQMLAIPEVMQVDVLDDHDLLIVLSERSVITFLMDSLDEQDPLAGLKRAKRVSSHTSFFKAGTCLGRTLVCVVKATTLSSTIKTLEPIDQNARGKNKPTFKKLLQGGNDTLRVFKEFYIPTESSSIHFLKTKLCVGCTKGFEIVDLETLDTQGLLDPADASLDFVQKRENVRPIAIYRIENEFLLCYDEFAFYVNKSGWRARPSWIVHWEGRPTSFALHYPFVLAFEPTFVEVRHVDTGTLIQVIPGNNLRCLYADTPPSQTNSAANLYNQYPHFRNLYHSRHSLHQPPYGIPPPPLPYGQLPPPHMGHQPNYSYGHPGQSSSPLYHQQRTMPYLRDEIILVSEDRVMAVRLAPPIPSPSSRTSLSSLSDFGPPSSAGTGSTTLI